MTYYRRPTPEEQQQLNERTLRLLLRDYYKCKKLNLTSVLPHMEKALVRWFKKANGIPLDDEDK